MLTYGDYTIDETAIPAPVVHKMLTSAFAHILGNEVASSVVGKIRKAIVAADARVDDKGVKLSFVPSRDDVEAYREANPSIVDGWEEELRKAKISAILDGTLSVRVARGPTRDPVEAAARGIARMELTVEVKKMGAKFPGKDETLTLVGQGGVETVLTADDLIDRKLAHDVHGPRIRKLAERKVAEDRRLRETVAKTVAGETNGLAASLGL